MTVAGATTYTYDRENRRVGVTAAGATTQYAISPHAALDQALVRTDAQGNKTYYVYGLGLIGQQDTAGYKTYHYDLRGSTVALTDASGNITDRFQYAPYGERVYQSGTTDTPFLYNGRDGVMSDSNGLYYLRARYYNPGIKRFISQDVVLGSIDNGQSLNRYAYANGQPVSMVDPFGLSPRDSEMKLSDKVLVFVVGTTGTLLLDDLTGIGFLDDLLIPGVVVIGGITYIIVKATEDAFENSNNAGEAVANPDVQLKDLKRLPDNKINDLGGEGYTSQIKNKTGKSKSDLYWNPKTGDVYSVPKNGGPPQHVDNIGPR